MTFAPDRVPVVAAAIIRGGRLLAARRNSPAAMVGGWEFPGGKVEPDEDEPQALHRECLEELGVEIGVGPRLGAESDGRLRIVLYAARIDSGDPRPLEDHDELRWLGPDELDTVDWLPIDRLLLPALRRHLDGSAQRRLEH